MHDKACLGSPPSSGGGGVCSESYNFLAYGGAQSDSNLRTFRKNVLLLLIRVGN
jgi:hypothetical protein